MKNMVPIIMGSKKDEERAQEIAKELKVWSIPYELRVASAHKHPGYVLEMMREYESKHKRIVYESVAGLSNGLSGMMAGNTVYPVIACPPYSEKYAGADIFSSLNMPSKIPVAVIPTPENAALYAVRIFALSDKELHEELNEYLKRIKESIEKDDKEVRELRK